MVGPILAIAAAAGIYYLAKGVNTKKAGDALILDFKDITNVRRSGWVIKFDVRFDATNPTGTTLNLEQAILDLKVSGVNGTVARVRNTNPISFTANQRKVISIPAETDNLLSQGLTMITILLSLFKGGVSNIKTGTLTGSVKANGFTSDYNQEISFKK